MAEMYRPGQTARGQLQTPETDPSSNWHKNQSDQSKQAGLWHYSGVDPRMSGEQRLDQRYQNYTYGTDPGYAARQAGSLQERGTGAQGTLGQYGSEAAVRANQAYGRLAPETDYGQANQTLDRQMGVGNRLMTFAAEGPGASRAQADLTANTAAAKRFALSQAGSGRGAGGGASAVRDAMTQNAITQGQANATAATLAAQEQDAFQARKLQAMGMAGDTYSDVAGAQGGQAQFLTQTELQNRGQNDQTALGYNELGLNAMQQGYATDLGYNEAARAEYENEAQANQAYEQNLTNLALGEMDLKNSREQRDSDEGARTTGAALGAVTAIGGAAAMFSDERGKTNMRETDINSRYAALNDNDDTLDKLKREREERQAERDKAARAEKVGGIQSMVSAVTGPYMSSDERSKERIQELEDLNDRYETLLDSAGTRLDNGIVDPYADRTAAAHAPASATTYQYKNPNAPGAGPGRYAGPMAQELQGIPGVVQNTPQGKMVDPARLTMANTSAIGSLERRQRALEAAEGKKKVDYVFDSNEEGGEGRKVSYDFGQNDDTDYRYEALNDGPTPAQPRAAKRIDTSIAPASPGVDNALRAFGNKPPSDAEIAAAREDLRSKYGSASAGEFERYAMALKRGGGRG